MNYSEWGKKELDHQRKVLNYAVMQYDDLIHQLRGQLAAAEAQLRNYKTQLKELEKVAT